MVLEKGPSADGWFLLRRYGTSRVRRRNVTRACHLSLNTAAKYDCARCPAHSAGADCGLRACLRLAASRRMVLPSGYASTPDTPNGSAGARILRWARSTRATSRRAFSSASESAVQPSVLRSVASAPASRSTETHSGWPCWAAAMRAVQPLSFTLLIAALLSSSCTCGRHTRA